MRTWSKQFALLHVGKGRDTLCGEVRLAGLRTPEGAPTAVLHVQGMRAPCSANPPCMPPASGAGASGGSQAESEHRLGTSWEQCRGGGSS